jgi:hypothetical protein
MSAFANRGRAVAHVQGSYVPILLQKSVEGTGPSAISLTATTLIGRP